MDPSDDAAMSGTVIRGIIPEHFLRLMPEADRRAMGKAGMTIPEIADRNAAKLEKQIHDQIEAYLRIQGITYRHDRMDRKTTGTVGWPDFTFAVNGAPVAIEVKRPGQRPTADQIDVMAGLVRDGWNVRVVFGVADVVDLVRSLRGGSLTR